MYKKLTLIMKFTTLILIASLMQVSASGLAQKLTLKKTDITLGKLVLEIRKQTGYDVFFENTKLKSSTKINANFNDTPLEKVMDQIVKPVGLTYVISNNTVIIKEKERGVFDKMIGYFFKADIHGAVLDSLGNPLTGANIRVKNTNTSVYTNARGEFNIPNLGPGTVLLVSYIGYLTREITVTGENADNIRIVLVNDISRLEEVTVVSTGYQTISKERSAGSFSKVNMDVVSNRSTSMNVLQSLDGLVPGLVVNNIPNRAQLLIRGLSTTGGIDNNGTTSQPLYVVDGLALPKTDVNDNVPDIVLALNPQDIESITVLKDATAASIWGARASNGVIVIKTKSGKLNTKLKINYNGFVNFQGKPDLGYNNLLSARQFVETGTEIFNLPGYLPQFPYATVSALNGGGITPLELILYNRSRNLISADQQARQLDSLANTDNSNQINDLLYRNALLSNHTLSLTGGGDKYSFYGSTSYTHTLNNTPGEKNENFKLNVRQDFKANKFLNLYVITDISNNTGAKKRYPSPNLLNSNIIDYFFTPYQMFRDANGNNLSIPFLTNQSNEVLANAQARSRINLDYNPMNEFENSGNTKSNGLLARINTGVTLNLFKGLTFDGTYGYIKGKNSISEFDRQQSYLVRREVATFAVAADPSITPKYYLPSTGGRLTNYNIDQHKWDIRNQLNYDNTFGKHQITMLAGQEAQEQFSSSLQNRVRGFDDILLTSPAVDYATLTSLIQGTILPNASTVGSTFTNDTFGTTETTTRFTSYYANFSYIFDRRYVLNASWRQDQSNLFGKDKSAQNKPIWSAGAKWNVSNEEFMRPVEWVQNLALRLTYGLTGNSPEVGVAASSDITRPSGSPFFPGNVGMLIVTPGNPLLSWESTKTINAGLDFSVLKGRISASLEVYSKKTTDLLGLVYPNSFTGFPTGIVGNQGDITNKGVEVSLSSVNLRTRDFSWSTNWVFAHNDSKIVRYTLRTPVTTGAQQIMQVAKEGYPAYPMFAYKYGGLDNTGAPQVILADGSVSKASIGTKPDDIAYMGTLQPIWNGGLSNNFQYKNIRLSANMVYNIGHVMRRDRNLTYGQQFRRNVSVDFLNRWKVPGDENLTNIPGYITSSDPNFAANTYNTDYFRFGDVNVVSASFVKLRDVTLFYDLPTELAGKIRTLGVTLRAQLSNVMLWKANKFGIDPEFQGTIPSNQNTITLGANISF
jgi:TonB-linked SusC/RagA family outer membrane protein